MVTRRFELFADYFQFYVQDEKAAGDLSDSWTPDAVARLLATAPGTVGVGTVRNVDVPVEIEVSNSEPDTDLSAWDQINECSVEVPSGRLVVAGYTDYFPDAERIDLAPGTYRVRVFYGSLDSVSDDGLDGSDHYRLVLWPGTPCEVTVLKDRPAG
jgi:hypothetical protein